MAQESCYNNMVVNTPIKYKRAAQDFYQDYDWVFNTWSGKILYKIDWLTVNN